MIDRTPAERLDRALDALLAQDAPAPAPAMALDPRLRPLLVTGRRVQLALAPLPAGDRFEARLAQRLAHERHRGPSSWQWPHPPAWLLLTGAVSSAAVGVGVGAYAVWRGNRRGALHRLVGR